MFRQSLLLLLRLSFRLTGRSFQRGGGTRLSGLAISLVFLGPASFAMAHAVERWLKELPAGTAAADRLILVLAALQLVWLAIRFAPEGLHIAGAGRLSLPLLRNYPISPVAIVLAETVGSLVDLPLFLLLPILIAAVHAVSGSLLPGAAVIALLLIQASFIQIALRQAAALFWRGRFRALITPAVRIALPILILAYAYMRSSAVTTSQPEIRIWKPRSHHVAQATAAPYEARLARWARVTPAGFAAQAIDARNAPASHLASAIMFTLFLATVAVVCGVATGLTRLSLASGDVTGAGNGRRFTARLLPARAYAPDSRTGAAFREVATVAAVEWRSLLRAPALHLPLRGPAMLLFILFFTLFAADMGSDALLNLQDFVGIGAVLYAFLWQVQFLCNRFGNEAGTAELLFGLPASRRRLIIGRNLALGALLLMGDYAAILLLGASAGAASHVMSGLILSLPVILVTTTSIGNLLSILVPFPIRNREGTQPREPPRELAFAYAIVTAANASVLYTLSCVLPVLRLPAASVILFAFYTGSLWSAERLLYRRESLLIARLNAGGGSAE